MKEGLTRLKGEREQLQDKLKELDAAKAPHDIVREQAVKYVSGWTDIGHSSTTPTSPSSGSSSNTSSTRSS